MLYNYPLNIDYPIDHYRQQYFDLYGNNLDAFDTYPEIYKNQAGYSIGGSKHEWGQQIVEDALGLEVETCRIFVIDPQKILPPHKDCVSDSHELRHCAVNIPLDNCDRGWNDWFNKSDYGEIYHSGGSAKVFEHYNFDLSKLKSDFRIGLEQPSLFRTDVFHSANNLDGFGRRVALSMRFKKNLSWEEMVERARKFNEAV
jgi:hypothetical protein